MYELWRYVAEEGAEATDFNVEDDDAQAAIDALEVTAQQAVQQAAYEKLKQRKLQESADLILLMVSAFARDMLIEEKTMPRRLVTTC